ncbi:unnamed protein product [Arctogadus glacialis]
MAAGFPLSSWVLPCAGMCRGTLPAPQVKSALVNHFAYQEKGSLVTADGLPGSTLGLKWDPSHCGPLGVCVDRAAPSAPRRGPTSAHAHLARLAREGQRGQRSQDSQGIHTSWRSHLPLLPP